VSSEPGGDAGLVALGVSEDPPLRCVRVGDEPATGGQGGGHPRLSLLVGDRDIEVLAVALRAWGVHRLELDARAPPPRVVEVVVVDLLVAEHRAPEGHHRGTDEGVDADVDQLHRSGIGHEVEPLGDGGDPPGQGDVTLRQVTVTPLRPSGARRHARRPPTTISSS
jgi:hypothetical protein